METIREQVIDFMEHNEQLTKLKGENWYKMEDSLVEFVEKLTNTQDKTYSNAQSLLGIIENWGNGILSEEDIKNLFNRVLEEKEPTFENFMKLINDYFDNTDGEFDGLAMELEEYFDERKDNRERIMLADGNYINLVKKDFTIELQDDLGQVLEEFNLTQGKNTYDDIKKHISKLDKYEYIETILINYDFEEDYHRLMETYFEDITLGNGIDAVEQEIKEIKKDLKTMSEKEFCENYGIFKIGNMYFRS